MSNSTTTPTSPITTTTDYSATIAEFQALIDSETEPALKLAVQLEMIKFKAAYIASKGNTVIRKTLIQAELEVLPLEGQVVMTRGLYNSMGKAFDSNRTSTQGAYAKY